MRRLRVSGGLARWVFYLVAAAGLASALRYTVAPPRPARATAPAVARVDPGAAEYAALFARSYLTWDAASPDAHQRALAPFLGPAQDPDAGLALPPAGSQHVAWVSEVQSRPGPLGDQVHTLAVQTDRQGLLYLTVEVGRLADGRLRIQGYPALVGRPWSTTADLSADQGLADVHSPGLAMVVDRALRNYLARSSANLAADLSAGARVSLPPQPLALHDVAQLKWAPGNQSVLATVHATGADDAGYTLRYELDVGRPEGRWEVAAIQIDPTA